MPHGYLEYSFDEPLFVREHYEAGSVQGTADISYNRDAAWSIDAIYLDAWDKIARVHNSKLEVPKGTQIYGILHERLTNGRTCEFIQSDVESAVEEDRQPDPDHERERRRDDAAFFADAR